MKSLAKLRNTINVRCPYCKHILCKRLPMHNNTEEVYGLHIKHRKLEIVTPQIRRAVFTCPSCLTKSIVDSEKGVIPNG